MAMKLIKKSADYKIFVRGDDRYAVQDSNGRSVNGEEKVRILVEEELIKVAVPSAPKAVADEEDAPAEEATVAEAVEQGDSQESTPEEAAPAAEEEVEVADEAAAADEAPAEASADESAEEDEAPAEAAAGESPEEAPASDEAEEEAK